MDNAGRWNIHAQAACGDAGMDRPAPSPDEDDGAGLPKTVRRSGCETPRLVPPGRSCMAVQRPEIPHEAYPDPSPRCRHESGLYGPAEDRASPTRGRSGKNLRPDPADCAKTDAFSAAPRPRPSSASRLQRNGLGPRRSHRIRLRGHAALRQRADGGLRIANAGRKHPPGSFRATGCGLRERSGLGCYRETRSARMDHLRAPGTPGLLLRLCARPHWPFRCGLSRRS